MNNRLANLKRNRKAYIEKQRPMPDYRGTMWSVPIPVASPYVKPVLEFTDMVSDEDIGEALSASITQLGIVACCGFFILGAVLIYHLTLLAQ